MRFFRAITFGVLVVAIGVLTGCDNFLKPEVHSQLAPENYLNTEQGLRSTLGSAYAGDFGGGVMWGNGTAKYRTLHMSDWQTGIMWQTGGGENRNASLMINFNWDPSTNVGQAWNRPYNAIRDANIVLDNLEGADISEEQRALFRAEARFIRALAYRDLYNWFGPVPLRTSTNEELEQPRASEDSMRIFIETEFSEVIPNLPDPGNQPQYGRATSAAAMAWLAKFYMNTQQYQEAEETLSNFRSTYNFSLYPDYFELFQVENERNDEFIWVDTMTPQGPGNPHMNQAFPPGFQSHPRTGLTMQDSWNNWASQARLREDFYRSFDEDDERTELIVREYVNAEDDTVDLLNDFEDNIRSFKWWPDPEGQGNLHGNDVPRIRFADILLMHAEAISEINDGPTQEAIDLVNRVRERAGLTGEDQLELANFDYESFRQHLLQERAWEFYHEGLRREDLIRFEVFIERAQERGVNAQQYRRRMPIPQFAMDANPELEQNTGYN